MVSRYKQLSWLKAHHVFTNPKQKGPSQIFTTLKEIDIMKLVRNMVVIAVIIDMI